MPSAVNDEFTGLFFSKIASYNAFVSLCCCVRNSSSCTETILVAFLVALVDFALKFDAINSSIMPKNISHVIDDKNALKKFFFVQELFVKKKKKKRIFYDKNYPFLNDGKNPISP